MGHHFKFKLLCFIVFHAYPSHFPFSLDTHCKNTEENREKHALSKNPRH